MEKLQLNFDPSEMLKVKNEKIILILLLSILSWNSSHALITVDITRGNLDPLPIAVSHTRRYKSEKIPSFETSSLGAEISEIIEKISNQQDYLIH